MGPAHLKPALKEKFVRRKSYGLLATLSSFLRRSFGQWAYSGESRARKVPVWGKPSSSRHQADILGSLSEDTRRMYATCSEGNAQKPTTKTSLNCLVISQALLPSFSRLTHAFGKGLPSSWSLLGLGKYLATPRVELGYTLGKAWVYRICTLGVPCQKRTTTKIDSRSSRIQEGQHHDC